MEPDDRPDAPESTTDSRRAEDLLAALGGEDTMAEDTMAEDTAREPESPACKLVGISVVADGNEILQEVSIDFPQNACTIIMGPSGSGKSTLLKTAAGLIVPSAGHVEILGTDPNRATDRELEHLRSRNGFVFQDDALWQNLSLLQNLILPLQYHRHDLALDTITERINRLVGELGATRRLELRPANVSAGERKIISFVRALVGDPEVLFLDEPTTSVDGEHADLMIRKLRDLKERNVTLVAVTHNARIASQLADYVVVLKEGRVLRFGSLNEISRSDEPEIERILTDVLSETATYDGDILELLDPDTNTYLT
ncbi:MAG: ATP-binding cassette domain-containing protein [Spirochaetia bacterium]